MSALKLTPVALILTILVILNRSFTVTAFTYVSAKIFELAENIDQSPSYVITFWIYLAFYLGVYLLRRIMEAVQCLCSDTVLAERLNHALGIELACYTSNMNLIEYEVPERLNALYRARACVDKGRVHQMITKSLNLLACVLGIGGIVSVLLSYHGILVLLSVISVLPLFVTRIIRGKSFYRLKKYQAEGLRKRDYLYRLFTDVSSVKEMRVFGSEGFWFKKWENINNKLNKDIWKYETKDAVAILLCNLFKALLYGGSLLVSIYFVYTRDISVGQFGSCILAFSFLQDEVETLIRAIAGIGDIAPFVNDYYSFIDISDQDNRKEIKVGDHINNIRLNNVYFSYPCTEKNALDNINLTIQRGEHIAIVGENGSGKTTLVKMLLGNYEPQKGEITCNSINMKSIDLQDFWSKISVVTQNFVKYHLSVRENIVISDIDRINDDENIYRVLDESGLSKAKNICCGLDEQMGREFGGLELSGGQWQKMAIARGLFRNYDLIVFDEPTSALDPIVEAEILNSFLKSIKDKTALIVSHRVGICRRVDRVIVMKNGKISECGSHDELMAMRGYYYQLYTEQEKWYR